MQNYNCAILNQFFVWSFQISNKCPLPQGSDTSHSNFLCCYFLMKIKSSLICKDQSAGSATRHLSALFIYDLLAPLLAFPVVTMSEQRLADFEQKLANLEERVGLLESVTQPIFKSSLAKGACDCLFWSQPSLMNRFVFPADIQLLQRLTEILGGNRDNKGTEAVRLFQLHAAGKAVSGRDASFITRAQLPRNPTRYPTFLDSVTSVDIDETILQRLRSEVSILLHLHFMLNL
jgi:hypothetical protein